ncbi:MAG: protein-L-isoaspartate(D-aspartate) O-methyltransferase [Planctomycetes bacterium]|nr:protein-L-isoaspartate(D-aspartate) O-methyltransferase [Planctomycetota bacterium]MBL7106677.1 protein-L-isoaspartate(D-aspartate) O-methyltransferase [Phycisphaerae bacterium]
MEDKFSQQRVDMVRFNLVGRDISDGDVLRVFGELAREEFVPDMYRHQAYSDGPLPIGLGQTISQPYIVALMTQHLRVDSDCEVLEIGTGSGYQTAVLAKLAKKVYTIERHIGLSESAQAVLKTLGIENVEYYIGDGSCGWPAEKTFDRIIITATVPQVPKTMLNQLKSGGLIVAPVGGGWYQQLIEYSKSESGISEKVICDVRFVKLVGKYGFEE